MSTDYVTKIAIVGAGGQFGKRITQALVTQGKHTITAITRADSTATIPPGVHGVAHVDYTSHASLVSALTGQEALIITLNRAAGPAAQIQLIDAARDAGVRWIMPNEYGIDPAHNTQLGEETRLGPPILAVRRHIEAAGLNWVGLACGFWYEFSLAGSEARYGFDIPRKTLTLFDEGTTPIPTSTWHQAATAVARIFALPLDLDQEQPSSSSSSHHTTSLPTPAPTPTPTPSLTLRALANRSAHVSSFRLSQRDMLASILRVTHDSEASWTVTSEPLKERYARGVHMAEQGELEGLVIMLYTRVFYEDGSGDFSAKVDNKALGLLEESLDEVTGRAVEMARGSSGHWAVRW